MHPRIAELTAYLDQQRRPLREAFDAVPPALRDQSLSPGRWSVAGIIEHLAIVETNLAARLAARIAQAADESVGPDPSTEPVIQTLNLAHLFNRTQPIAANEAVWPTGLSSEAAWRALEDAGDAVRSALRSGETLALGEIFMPHTRFGEASLHYFFPFVGAHEARHAAQIREIANDLFAKTATTHS